MPHSKIPHRLRVELAYDPDEGWRLLPATQSDDDTGSICVYCFAVALPHSIAEYLRSAEQFWDELDGSNPLWAQPDLTGRVRPHEAPFPVFEYDSATGLLKPQG